MKLIFYLFLVPNTTSLIVWQFVNSPCQWATINLSIHRRSGSTFRALAFHSCAQCREVSHRELSKYPVTTACILSVITQDSWPQVRIGTETYFKTDSFATFEIFATAERYSSRRTASAYQSFYQFTCSAFRDSWISPPTYRSAVG